MGSPILCFASSNRSSETSSTSNPGTLSSCHNLPRTVRTLTVHFSEKVIGFPPWQHFLPCGVDPCHTTGPPTAMGSQPQSVSFFGLAGETLEIIPWLRPATEDHLPFDLVEDTRNQCGPYSPWPQAKMINSFSFETMGGNKISPY